MERNHPGWSCRPFEEEGMGGAWGEGLLWPFKEDSLDLGVHEGGAAADD